MFRRIYILCIALFAVPVLCFAQHIRPEDVTSASESLPTDTIGTVVTQRNQRLYDSLEVKSNRRAVPRMMYQLLIRARPDSTSSGQVVDESRTYTPFEGKTIGNVTIERSEVFDKDGNWFERTGNKIHVMTRERVIRRDLLFKPGDPLDPQQIVTNKQLLRSRKYISDAEVEVLPDAYDSTLVNVIVRTRDSWTISADLGLSGEGRTMIGVYDANIFGTGNNLKIKTHFNRTDFSFGGELVEYEIPNILGTFFRGNLSGGRNFYNNELKVGINKEFIRPTDYEAGITYEDVQSKYYMIDRDSADVIKSRRFNVWGGHSRFLKEINSSIYFTGRYEYTRFSRRPEITPTHNYIFHNSDNLLFGLGLYREKFYTANLIYGFGFTEYLSTGYNAELIGGYSWGEFDENMYLGMSYKVGGFNRAGYMLGRFSLGSYIDLSTGMWRRSAVDVDLRWFSNLYIFRRNRIRQFVEFNYTQGWNRGTGNDEIIRFTGENSPRVLREYLTGTNRMVINNETVLFTPYQPLGFRIAIFAFADIGLLGDSPNIFKNEFFGSVGFGVRIKNERLIFSAIQLTVGLAFGKPGLVNTRYFDLSNENRLNQYRFLPSRPEIVGFK